MRAIPTSPPKTSSVVNPLDKIPSIHVGWTYIRGCGSNLTQVLNPHIKVRPLRQVVYSRLNCGSVLEILPHWKPEDKIATLQEKLVESNDELDKLLDSPREAFDKFFGDEEKPENVSELEWKNHVFSEKSVIADLCVWAKPHRDHLDILRSLL